MIDSSQLAPLSPAERWIRQMERKEMDEQNDDASVDNVDLSHNCFISLNEPPTFSNLPSFRMAHSLPKHRDLECRDGSLYTEATVSDELSLSVEENDGTQDTSFHSSSIGIDEDVHCNSVRFADEIGLPIEHILLYECDRKQREHSELLVLCMCPEKKKFEFLHVGYHHHQENNDESDDENDDKIIQVLTSPTMYPTNTTTAATVQDLIQGLPNMCTDPIFVNANFVTLYRNKGKGDSIFRKLEEHLLPLTNGGFRENELVVAAIEGSSERAVLEGIGPLLSNNRIMTTLKRGRRSRRSLKFVRSNGNVGWRRLKILPSSSSSSMMTRRKSIITKKSDYICSSTTNSSNKELVDEYCHDYDPFNGTSEDKWGQLFHAFVAVFVGTLIFSTFGL